jgi:phosphoribosyl 1,2-cyclic phosphodiesterase
LRFTLLGSGSSGNVAYIEAGGTRVLVDAGLPKSEIESRLLRIPDPAGPITLDRIDGVLVTHDHSDHVGCAASLGRPVWATSGTRRAAQLDAQLVRSGDAFSVGALSVMPTLLPHDAEETVGYVLSDGQMRVGILTDCGWDAPEVAAAFAGCDALVLETNHDAEMLRYGPYPHSLKRRVGGRRGHLSNEQSASLLKAMLKLGAAPKLVVAAHLSQANNRPLLARRALVSVLGRAGRVIVATQSRGCPLIALERGKVACAPDRFEQLTFEFAQRQELQ